MGLAMVAGNFAYGPLERILHTRKWLNVGGNALVLAFLLALAALARKNAACRRRSWRGWVCSGRVFR